MFKQKSATCVHVLLTNVVAHIIISSRLGPTKIMRSFIFSACSAALLSIAVAAADTTRNLIGADFTDRQYRIERRFAHTSVTSQVLSDLIHKGTPAHDGKDDFPVAAVKKIGDAGNMDLVQYEVFDYSSALQTFTQPEYHEQNVDDPHSLVYYIEKLDDGPSFERSKEIINSVASPTFMEDGGSVHLYMSSPGTAALANHTDITDIVVLQLDGAKEWLLCSEKGLTTASPADHFSNKLDACSSYGSAEMNDLLDCERTILYPGDVLFLPRRVVHSARSLPDSYSAHLTFGYSKEAVCGDYDAEGNRQLWCNSCISGCDSGCDSWCEPGTLKCRGSCDESCDSYFGS